MSLKPWQQHVLLWLIILAAYFQVAFMQYMLQWDMVDAYFPWRRLIADSLRSGILPLWNPYEHLGYPLHADPQSGVWYPVTWVIGLLTGYSVYGIQLEYILHLCIAASGMMVLASTLGMSSTASIILSLAYSLGGVFTSNAQHLTMVAAAAWLPFAVGAFLQFLNTLRYKHMLTFVLILSLMITGGYPGILFILAYLLLTLLIVRSVEWHKGGQNRNWLKLAKASAIGIVVLFVLTAGYTISIFEAMPLMLRGEGVTLERALFGAFTVPSTISFIFPYATVKDSAYFGTDVSMANGYAGLIPLSFFLLALIRRISRKEWTFMIFGTVCLAVALGDALPFREWLYRFFPLMDLFRFPALFRIFVLLCLLIPAGFSIDYVLARRRMKILSALVILLGAVSAGAIFYHMDRTAYLEPVTSGHGLVMLPPEAGRSDHIVFQGFLQLCWLSLLLALTFYGRKSRHLRWGLIGLTAIDMMTAVQLNIPHTVVSYFKPVQAQEALDSLPRGFPPPVRDLVIDNKDIGIPGTPFWRNTNIFLKRVSDDGFNPFILHNFEFFYNAPCRDSALHHPFIFLSDELEILPERRDLMRETPPTRETLFTSSEELGAWPADIVQEMAHVPSDQLTIKSFSPNHIVAEVSLKKTQLLTLLQNDYPGWKAMIDGEETQRIRTDFTLQSVVVPAGGHTVEFLYSKAWLPWMLGLAILGFPLLTFYLFPPYKRKK